MISAWNYYVKLLNDGSFKYSPEQNSTEQKRIESSRTARRNCDGPSCCFLLMTVTWARSMQVTVEGVTCVRSVQVTVEYLSLDHPVKV